MLQYITNTDCPTPVAEQIKAVIRGGCRWVQIRMKEATDEEIEKVVEEVKPIAAENDCLLLLDDRVELCNKLALTGVHLGKEDMLPSKARVELGPLAVIGVTANTFEDVVAVRSLDVDYLGVGPFRATTTKKNLAPVLGIEGIKSIINKMQEAEIEIPVVAIGGIKADDIPSLLEIGCKGIAVSGAIAFADNLEEATRRIISLLPVGY